MTILVAPGGRGVDAGRTLADSLFDAVKREIVENRLTAGTILSELTIAARYSVSRAPAREALKRLAAAGFVTARQRVGYVVSAVSVADVDEIFTLRFVLEPLATELAVPRLTGLDAQILEDLASAVLSVPSRPPDEHGGAYSRLNADFHREIARISGNRRLERTITGLIDELERVMHMLAYSATIGDMLDEHQALLQVMRSGDSAAAAQLMHQQLLHDYEVMCELVVASNKRCVRSCGCNG